MITIGTQTNHKLHGIGTVIEVNDRFAKVDFSGNIVSLLAQFVKPYKSKITKSKEAKEVNLNKMSIFNGIRGDKQMRGFNFAQIPNDVYNQIERKAMEQGNFVHEIVESARNGKFISDKQAWAVAFFAEKNNLI